jgi:prepilin-type N-terminal cleavage/methylation domain-containing protein
MKKRTGFTLIELLVVISIIALLLSIMMPALGRVKKIAKQTVCLTNIRQLGVAMETYGYDNNGSFLRGIYGITGPYVGGKGFWLSDLNPYYGKEPKVLICPQAKQVNPSYDPLVPFGPNSMGWINYSAAYTYPIDGITKHTVQDPYNPFPLSYSMNIWATNPEKGSPIDLSDNLNGLYTPNSYFWRKSARLTSPSRVPLLGDGRWLVGYPNSQINNYLVPTDTMQELEGLSGGTPMFMNGLGMFSFPRHPKGINMIFGDLSARSVELTELWGFKWNAAFSTSNDWTTGVEAFPGWLK